MTGHWRSKTGLASGVHPSVSGTSDGGRCLAQGVEEVFVPRVMALRSRSSSPA